MRDHRGEGNFTRALIFILRAYPVAIEASKSAASIPVAFHLWIRKAISAQNTSSSARIVSAFPIGSIGV